MCLSTSAPRAPIAPTPLPEAPKEVVTPRTDGRTQKRRRLGASQGGNRTLIGGALESQQGGSSLLGS